MAPHLINGFIDAMLAFTVTALFIWAIIAKIKKQGMLEMLEPMKPDKRFTNIKEPVPWKTSKARI